MSFSYNSGTGWTASSNLWVPYTKPTSGPYSGSDVKNFRDFISANYGTESTDGPSIAGGTIFQKTNANYRAIVANNLDTALNLDSTAIPTAWALRIFGSNVDDQLKGGTKTDYIQGANGNDTIKGEGGNDQLWGGGGNDEVRGGSGHDALYGNNGNDVLYGDAGNDLLLGDEGDDTLYGGEGNDDVFGGEGNDIMFGGNGADKFYLSELSGIGTKIKDFSYEEGDTILIIDTNGSKDSYKFAANGNTVEIRNSTGTLLATVEGTSNVNQVKERTSVGSSPFKGYDDTTPNGGTR